LTTIPTSPEAQKSKRARARKRYESAISQVLLTAIDSCIAHFPALRSSQVKIAFEVYKEANGAWINANHDQLITAAIELVAY
jgi:hypothetical protein